MGRFDLDTEFTNGNYYLAIIIEIALVAEDSENTFHSYIKIHYSIPKRLKELMDITDKTLATIGCSLKDMVISLIEFIHNEQLRNKTDPIIIAHGGHLHDFPILLANCIKHNFGVLIDCLFVDSVHIFENEGYRRPGLDTLCQGLDIQRNMHSALGDARILKEVFNKKLELLDHPYGYTFMDVVVYFNGKLPISISKLYTWAIACCSYAELELSLIKYVKKNTALNINQVYKIAY